MHHDIIKITNKDIIKPQGKITLVYWSSKTENTKRFVEKINCQNFRIPLTISEETIVVNQDYVLVLPTYSGGGSFTKGAVPKQVIKFLNIKNNRNRCRGIIATGNTNFGQTYCLAGPIVSQKLKVPLLYQLELSGTIEDVKNVKKILRNFWNN